MINKYKVMKAIQPESDKMKIAIIGSRVYENKKKIKEMIFKLKNTFGVSLEIASGGTQTGADKYVKKYALELGVTYREFNPAHTSKNLYSVMPESYYGKPYHFSQLHHRMQLIAERCDYMMILSNQTQLDPVLQTAWTRTKKLQKPVVILG